MLIVNYQNINSMTCFVGILVIFLIRNEAKIPL